MAFWNKKKKDNKDKKENNNKANSSANGFATKPISNATEQSKNINQQASKFSVNPEFFDYEKVKLNAFLTDCEEYNKQKIINDLPNKDTRYLNSSKDQIEILSRFNADEKAFSEIYTNVDNKLKYNNLDFNLVKNEAIENLNQLNDDNIRAPIKTQVYDQGFYQRVGNGIDEEIEKISNDTKKFLNEMQTKILDLNNVKEPYVNSAADYTNVGDPSNRKCYLANTIMNNHQKLKNDDNNCVINNTSMLTTKDFNNLRTQNFSLFDNRKTSLLSNYNDDALTIRTKNLNNVDIINQQIDGAISRNKTIEFNNDFDSINHDESYEIKKTKKILDQAQTIDQIMTREINKEINIYETIQPKIRQQVTKLLENEHNYIKDLSTPSDISDMIKEHDDINEISSFHEITASNNATINSKKDLYADLIPVNEIKMDLRIRKAERRNFAFNPRGHF